MPKKKKVITTKKGQSKSKTTTGPVKDSKSNKLANKKFPVVGLGASAGGLEALRSFFAKVPVKSGMAFIVVVHMTPKQPSLMPELLQKVTLVPVSAAKDGQAIESDHIYVVPPNKEINVFNGSIQLLDVIDKHSTLPIDLFLRTLAQDQRGSAVAVILSGTGTDGTLGVKEIKANDGLVMVQSEDSAGYDGMPRSAINTGLVDIIAPAKEMPEKLTQYFAHHHIDLTQKSTDVNDRQSWMNKIFAVLRAQVGHDFSQYKVNTLLRRISRRMGLNQINCHEQYLRYLRENSMEVEALFRELLIGVTNFFRDAESFDVLKSTILPELLDQLKNDATFRAWIPGCSTGEEVYSLAIVAREVLGKNPKHINLQLFGTDIDNYAIEKAREGLFPASITADVSEDRLNRFFTKEGHFFRIRQDIRDCAVFSVQDLIKDPPFSRLHLLCCRNLLIYLDSDAQKKLLPLFHYTLAPKGVLMLGSAETIGGYSRLFKTLDKKWKLFRRREVPQALRHQIEFPSGPYTKDAGGGIILQAAPEDPKVNIAQITQRAILEQFAPTALLIDSHCNILHVQGRAGQYLETPSGPPTQNILDMAREGLRIELSSAIRTARSTNQKVTRRKINVKTNGNIQMIDLHVSPQQAPKELSGRFLVVFENVETHMAPGSGPDDPGHLRQESDRISELERELQSTRESHQTTIEELESSNEELKSTNEEMQSSNEELQSTNEELESSREELQSLNEELHTVNAELQSKVEELSAAHDDMRNLLNSTEVATIFVDNTLRVRRFTPEATAIINLIQSDIGRPIQHVVTNLTYEGMIADLGDVLKNLSPIEVEVQTTEGDWYKMRIIPYRTTDNRIDGAVLTFASIIEQKKVQQALKDAGLETEQARKLIRHVFDMNPDPLAVLDNEGKMVIANSSFSDLMKISPKKIQGMDVIDLKKNLDETELVVMLKNALDKGENFQINTRDISQLKEIGPYLINGQIIHAGNDPPYRILLSFLKKR